MDYLFLILPLLALPLFFVLPWAAAIPLYIVVLIGSLIIYIRSEAKDA